MKFVGDTNIVPATSQVGQATHIFLPVKLCIAARFSPTSEGEPGCAYTNQGKKALKLQEMSSQVHTNKLSG